MTTLKQQTSLFTEEKSMSYPEDSRVKIYPKQTKANQSITGQSGLRGERTGLFYHMCRAIQEIGPQVVIAENVGDLLTINSGNDFREILSQLAGMGYNAEWRICRSSDVGAPHHRERVYIVAYTNDFRLSQGQSFFSYVSETPEQIGWQPTGTLVQTYRGGAWASEPPFPCVDDGFSKPMAGFSASQWRKEQIKALGNAVTPQIPYGIFKSIKELLYI